MSDDIFYSFLGKGVALAFALLPLAPLLAQQPTPHPVKNIVLIHGDFAGGTSRSTRMGDTQSPLPDLP